MKKKYMIHVLIHNLSERVKEQLLNALPYNSKFSKENIKKYCRKRKKCLHQQFFILLPTFLTFENPVSDFD